MEAARPLGSAPQDTSGERRGGKWRGFGVSWLAVQPSSPAHRLCEPRGPQLPHLPNENSHPARTSVLLSLSSPDQLLPCPLHSSAPSPRSGQGSSSNLQPPQRVLALLWGSRGWGGGVRLVEQHLPGTSSYVWCLLSCWSRPRAASCQSFSSFFPYREARLSLWPCPQESPHLLPTAEGEDGSLSRVAWWPPIHHMVPGRSPREPPPSTRYEPWPHRTHRQFTDRAVSRVSVLSHPCASWLSQDFWQAGLAGTGWPPLLRCRPC